MAWPPRYRAAARPSMTSAAEELQASVKVESIRRYPQDRGRRLLLRPGGPAERREARRRLPGQHPPDIERRRVPVRSRRRRPGFDPVGPEYAIIAVTCFFPGCAGLSDGDLVFVD